MESCNPSIIELLDETGELLCSVIKRDSEVWEVLPVLFISRWAFAKPIIVIVVDLLLEYSDLSFEPLDLLPVDIISDPDGVSEPSDNGPELVWGWVRGGSEDVLYRGGGERKSPGVGGGESNSCTFFSEVAGLEGVIWAETEVSWEAISGLFRG